MLDFDDIVLENYYENIFRLQMLNESPDIIKTKYLSAQRSEYRENVIIFMGSKNGDGLVYAPLADFTTHSSFFRYIVMHADENLSGIGKFGSFASENAKPEELKKLLHMDKSGVVLKQSVGHKNRPDIHESYISIWTGRDDKNFINLLKEFAIHLKLPLPVYLEYFEGNGDPVDNEETLMRLL